MNSAGRALGSAAGPGPHRVAIYSERTGKSQAAALLHEDGAARSQAAATATGGIGRVAYVVNATRAAAEAAHADASGLSAAAAEATIVTGTTAATTAEAASASVKAADAKTSSVPSADAAWRAATAAIRAAGITARCTIAARDSPEDDAGRPSRGDEVTTHKNRLTTICAFAKTSAATLAIAAHPTATADLRSVFAASRNIVAEADVVHRHTRTRRHEQRAAETRAATATISACTAHSGCVLDRPCR